MLLDIPKSREIPISSTQDAIDFLKSDISHQSVLNELNKLLQIILTVPVSSCTAERSFSALRRLKTFLRSTMSQNRLNVEWHGHWPYFIYMEMKMLISK